MIGFAIPFRPKKTSLNWENDNLTLIRTLHSILYDPGSKVKVVICTTDPLLFDISDDRIYIQYMDNSNVTIDDFAHKERIMAGNFNNATYTNFHIDKSLKIIQACKILKDMGCQYLMAVDSDDLISKKLIEFISAYEGVSAGWVVTKGYMYFEKSNYLSFYRKNFNSLNGSTNVLAAHLVRTDLSKPYNWNIVGIFTDHGYTALKMKHDYDLNVNEIHFPAVIYIRGAGTNISNEIGTFKDLKSKLKRLFRFKWLSKQIKKEYQLYPLDRFRYILGTKK